MLKWNEIKGYDKNKSYTWQNESVKLPKLNEIIMILKPEKKVPFVGYFEEKEFEGVRIYDTLISGELGRIKDGIKWARFNMFNDIKISNELENHRSSVW